MIEDKSMKMNIRYGWDDMPVEFAVDTGDSLVSDFNFYDAQGIRVTRLIVKTETRLWVPIMLGDITFFVKGFKNTADLSAKVISTITDVNILSAGDRRWVENYGETGAIASSSASYGVFGITGQTGEIAPNGSYRFFIKNHLGSTMRSVGDNGEFLDAEGNVLDYLSYGSQKKLKVGGTDVNPTFTGKELEVVTGLYAFGARWYDPELGSFMSPDPVRQFANPYSYGPNDPMNGTDPTGMVWDIFRPSKWAAAGREVNEYTEKAYNKAFNDECHYETNSSCRGNIQDKVAASDGIGQLEASCNRGDGSACTVLSQIGLSQYQNNLSQADHTDAERRLAVLIFKGGSHKIGINISMGGGMAAPAIQYDDVTIPLGAFNTGSAGGGSIDDSKGLTFIPREPSGAALVEYNVIKGAAQDFWERNINSDMHAAIAKYGTSDEIGLIYNRSGNLKFGPALGTTHKNGVKTMGADFQGRVGMGNIVAHSHPYSKGKASMGFGGLSPGDMGWVRNKNIGLYAYETSNHRLYYSNPRLINLYGNDLLSLSNMYLGDY